MTIVRVFSTPQLVLAAEQADRYKYNRRVKTEELRHLLDPDGRHVVAHHAMVNDSGTIRCVILAKYRLDERPHELCLDVAAANFNKLAEFEAPDEEEETFA